MLVGIVEDTAPAGLPTLCYRVCEVLATRGQRLQPAVGAPSVRNPPSSASPAPAAVDAPKRTAALKAQSNTETLRGFSTAV